MDKINLHAGVAAPLMRINIDTDAIIPSKRMRSVSKKGLGPSAFFNWRYNKDGSDQKDFVLNQPEYKNASILLAGKNFGCGSSREHAVWALHEFGIKVIIAPSFGSIFYKNCIRNGLLPATLGEVELESLVSKISASTDKHCSIDLGKKSVLCDDLEFAFEIADSDQEMLIAGLDPIDQTLQQLSEIERFIEQDKQKRGWAHL